MLEISAKEQKEEKRMKRIEDNLRDLWDNTKAPTFELYGSQKKKRKRKGLRKYLKRLYWKTSLHGKGNSHPSPGSTDGPIQDKPKEKQTKTKY